MLHVDEKWHTENFSWGNARTRRKEFWNKEIEDRWKSVQEQARTRLVSCYTAR